MPCDLYFHFRTLTRRITEIQNQSSKRFIRYNSLPNYRLNYIPVSMTHLLWVIGRHNDEMLLQVNLLVFACLVNQLSNQILLQLKIWFSGQVTIPIQSGHERSSQKLPKAFKLKTVHCHWPSNFGSRDHPFLSA